MESPSPILALGVNPFPCRFINRTDLPFLYFHWLFAISARETLSGNRSIYKGKGSTQEINGDGD